MVMHAVPRPLSSAASFMLAIVRTDRSRASLAAAGELDLAAVDDLAAVLASQEAAGRKFIRVDMSAVTFMDCSCLGVLVGVHRRLAAVRGQLVLSDPSTPVLRLFVLTGLTEQMLTTPTSRTLAAMAHDYDRSGADDLQSRGRPASSAGRTIPIQLSEPSIILGDLDRLDPQRS